LASRPWAAASDSGKALYCSTSSQALAGSMYLSNTLPLRFWPLQSAEHRRFGMVRQWRCMLLHSCATGG
jgi:hypothetical protein